MDFLMNVLGGIGGLVVGTLYLGVIFSIIYTVLFYIPRRFNEIEKRIKQLENKESK